MYMITLTPRAITELKDVLESQGQASAKLRVFVQPGGCSGLSYGMQLEDEEAQEGDQVFEQEGIQVVIDDLSLRYMTGASVDFVDDGVNSGFKIDNPNAVSGCGCGSSFQTEETVAQGGGCGGCGSRG